MLSHQDQSFTDNGGRRTGFERRQFAYSGHIPERRLLSPDRRSDTDRRSGQYRSSIMEDRRTKLMVYERV